MMEELDTKRLRRSNNNNTDSDSDSVVVVVDRISVLPNYILGVILSFLTTKRAVSTSVLSKRWKSAWVHVHNLVLSSRDFVKPRDFFMDGFDDIVAPVSADFIPFIRFVHKAFLLIDARRPLYKFSLDWHTFVDSSHVICWIDAAIHRKVREIDLYLLEGDLLTLPISGFNCDSLRSLEIYNICFDYDTTMVCLPRLETLKLKYVRFTSEEAFAKLINGCPMLHHLKLINDDDDDDDDDDAAEDFIYVLSSPSLRHLHMHIEDRCRLKLNVPSVEYLKLRGRISEIFAEKSLSSLIEADFDTQLDEDELPHNLIVEAVRVLEHAKFLTLSARVLQALSRATISLSTEFKRLVKLVVGNYCCIVQDFILNSENLEDLIIFQHSWLISEPHDHSRWRANVEVPRCLLKSLKRVRLDGYKGLEDGREMIRYMLEHGTALEVMQIHCASKEDGEKIELLQEICDFPRKSPGCKVQFNVWPRKREFQVIY